MGRTKQATPTKRRFRPGTVALREIRRYQRSTETLIPRMAFRRFVRELTQNCAGSPDIRYQSDALLALQDAAEAYLVGLFIASERCRVHASRETVSLDDLKLAESMIPVVDHHVS